MGLPSLPNVERRHYRARMTEWRERKTRLRMWAAAAHAAGNKQDADLLGKAITQHNKRMPTKEEGHAAWQAYNARRARFEAQQAVVDLQAEGEFRELDRLMRERYGVNLT